MKSWEFLPWQSHSYLLKKGVPQGHWFHISIKFSVTGTVFCTIRRHNNVSLKYNPGHWLAFIYEHSRLLGCGALWMGKRHSERTWCFHLWGRAVQEEFFLDCLTLKALWSFDISGTICPITQHHTVEDLKHVQQCHCKDHKSCSSHLSFSVLKYGD
jgi:hypothetical protein